MRTGSVSDDAAPSAAAVTAEERVMAATLEALVALDPSALTIQRICRSAGVTPPTVYYHFGSKDGLVAAAIERMVADWLDTLDRQIPRAGHLEEAIARACGAWEAMVLEPARPLAVFSWATLLTAAGSLECRAALLQARRRSEAMLEEGLRHHVAEDDARAGMASLILDVLLATALQYHLDGDAVAVQRRIAVLAETIRRAAGE